MESGKEAVPSRKQIAEYWQDKYISKNFEMISHYEEGAEPVIHDLGEPECWACGRFNEKICDNQNYDKVINTKQVMRIWNFPEAMFLQRAHVLSKMLGGKNNPSNYFLLCKKCHQESPDYLDLHYFYAYILHTRRNARLINVRRNKEMQRAVYELAYEMKKNIFTFDKAIKNIDLTLDKAGLHITNFSLYTIASAIVDGMDNVTYNLLTDEEFMSMQNEFLKFDINLKR